MKEAGLGKRLLCRGLDKPVLHLWSSRSSFPSTLPLSSAERHILRSNGSLQYQEIELRDTEQKGWVTQCRHCVRRLSNDKSFIEKVRSGGDIFRTERLSEGYKRSKYIFCSFPQHYVIAPLGPISWNGTGDCLIFYFFPSLFANMGGNTGWYTD